MAQRRKDLEGSRDESPNETETGVNQRKISVKKIRPPGSETKRVPLQEPLNKFS